jgi:hypothetical protein
LEITVRRIVFPGDYDVILSVDQDERGEAMGLALYYQNRDARDGLVPLKCNGFGEPWPSSVGVEGSLGANAAFFDFTSRPFSAFAMTTCGLAGSPADYQFAVYPFPLTNLKAGGSFTVDAYVEGAAQFQRP